VYNYANSPITIMNSQKDKIALITGINGQDGSYLAEYLLKKGYTVHGTKRLASTINTERIKHLIDYSAGIEHQGKIIIHHADLTDSSSLSRVVDLCKPTEIYNLAAQSHVAVSFEEPEFTANVDALGVLRLLEIIRRERRNIKLYQASTSELFGGINKGPYNENSLIDPRSPYAAAKAYAYYLVKQYRMAYNIYAVNGILFNHESPRRGENFVTRKISRGIAGILKGTQKYIGLGNLNATRDWGHAKEYVIAMYLMMQKETPEDYVIASGSQVTVRKFIEYCFRSIGIELEFSGEGTKEIGMVKKINKNPLSENKKEINYFPKLGDILVRVDSSLFRPLEVENLKGNSLKAKNNLGWVAKTSIEELAKEMVKADLKNI
jgi:GDPmannose 4,6-dehydratase